MTNNCVGIKIKELRLDNNLSQRELGEIFGVCNQTISFWELGSREPDLDMIVAIAKYFGVSCDYLLGIESY